MPKGLKGFQKGHPNYQTLESRKKISESHKGKKAYQWKHGLSKSKEYHSFIERRRKAKKRQNGGFHTLGEWENLKAQYNWVCLCCKVKEPQVILTEDHIIPISKGGSDNIENIQPLCRKCNLRKNAKIINYVQS